MSTDHSPPPRHPPKLKAQPAIRQFFWCDFPKDAHMPEMWKVRPVIVVSYRNTLRGAVTVVPCTTVDQQGAPWAFPLRTTIDGTNPSWALVDKITTVAVSRLTPDKTGMRRMPVSEFDDLLTLLLRWLPRPGGDGGP